MPGALGARCRVPTSVRHMPIDVLRQQRLKQRAEQVGLQIATAVVDAFLKNHAPQEDYVSTVSLADGCQHLGSGCDPIHFRGGGDGKLYGNDVEFRLKGLNWYKAITIELAHLDYTPILFQPSPFVRSQVRVGGQENDSRRFGGQIVGFAALLDRQSQV